MYTGREKREKFAVYLICIVSLQLSEMVVRWNFYFYFFSLFFCFKGGGSSAWINLSKKEEEEKKK